MQLRILLALLISGLGCQAVDIIAHRGASADAPENTVHAARLGWAHNADAVEVDIHLSKDGRIVVIHDDNTKRTAGRDARVRDQTFEELQQLDAGSWKGTRWAGVKIPSLEEIIETVPNDKRLVIEIKGGLEIIEPLKQTLKTCRHKREQMIVIGFSYPTMTAFKQALPEYETYWLSGFEQDKATRSWTPTADELIEKARAAGFEGLNLSHKGPVDAALVKKVKEAGLKILVWTVNDPAIAKRLVNDGVEGITTDRPAWLREQLK